MRKVSHRLATKEFIYKLESKVEDLAKKLYLKYKDRFQTAGYELILSLDRAHINYDEEDFYPMAQDQCLDVNYNSTLNLSVKNAIGSYEWINQKPSKGEPSLCSYPVWSVEKGEIIPENWFIARKYFYMLPLNIEQLESYLEEDISAYMEKLKIN